MKSLGIILFLQRFIQLLLLIQFLLPFCLKGTSCSLHLRATSSHAIFIMILFEPDFHVLIELLLVGQSLL